MKDDLLDFGNNTESMSIIKVIGIGGGGSNAVNYMCEKGIADVSFVICNTDAQALENSPVTTKIQLGDSLTEGRGAGNMPELGEKAAEENIDLVREVLVQNTQMCFITACLGGGTGTGAAPVIARLAKELGILTIAVVTIPSKLEGNKRYNQAMIGLGKIREIVDSLLVINNEKIGEIYGNLPASEAFSKADHILATAVKGVAEIITLHGNINIDFADVKTVMADSKVFIMGIGEAEGENRAMNATNSALESPLLDSNDICGTTNILMNITSGDDEITMGEVGEIIERMQELAGQDANIIWGNGIDTSLGNKVSVTIIATDFAVNPSSILWEKQEELKAEPEQVLELDPESEEIFIPDDESHESELDEPVNEKKPTARSARRKRKEKKQTDEKVDNWFMRSFNNMFEENSSEFD